MWEKIKLWFAKSETIFWARLQIFVGAIWTVLIQADLAPLLSPKTLSIWLVVSGVITEYMRRRRATDLP